MPTTTAAVVLITGIPASGKSTLAELLRRKFEHQQKGSSESQPIKAYQSPIPLESLHLPPVITSVFSFDAWLAQHDPLLVRGARQNRREWQTWAVAEMNRAMLGAEQKKMAENNMVGGKSEGEACGDRRSSDGTLLLLLLDDTFHVASMRRPFRRWVAAKKGATLLYLEVFIDCPLQVALSRNEERSAKQTSSPRFHSLGEELDVGKGVISSNASGIRSSAMATSAEHIIAMYNRWWQTNLPPVATPVTTNNEDACGGGFASLMSVRVQGCPNGVNDNRCVATFNERDFKQLVDRIGSHFAKATTTLSSSHETPIPQPHSTGTSRGYLEENASQLPNKQLRQSQQAMTSLFHQRVDQSLRRLVSTLLRSRPLLRPHATLISAAKGQVLEEIRKGRDDGEPATSNTINNGCDDGESGCVATAEAATTETEENMIAAARSALLDRVERLLSLSLSALPLRDEELDGAGGVGPIIPTFCKCSSKYVDGLE